MVKWKWKRKRTRRHTSDRREEGAEGDGALPHGRLQLAQRAARHHRLPPRDRPQRLVAGRPGEGTR